jgi:hypothetical protein
MTVIDDVLNPVVVYLADPNRGCVRLDYDFAPLCGRALCTRPDLVDNLFEPVLDDERGVCTGLADINAPVVIRVVWDVNSDTCQFCELFLSG